MGCGRRHPSSRAIPKGQLQCRGTSASQAPCAASVCCGPFVLCVTNVCHSATTLPIASSAYARRLRFHRGVALIDAFLLSLFLLFDAGFFLLALVVILEYAFGDVKHALIVLCLEQRFEGGRVFHHELLDACDIAACELTGVMPDRSGSCCIAYVCILVHTYTCA